MNGTGFRVRGPNGAEQTSGPVGIGTTPPAGAPVGTLAASNVTTPYEVNIKSYGAQGLTRSVTDAAIETGTKALTSATAGFTSSDIGRIAVVTGAGAAAADLVTTVAAIVDATTAMLADAAGTTVADAFASFSTDDTAAIQAAIDAIPEAITYPDNGGYLLRIPRGTFTLSAPLTIGPRRLTIIGGGLAAGSNISILRTYNPAIAMIDATRITDTFSMLGVALWGAGAGKGAGNGVTVGRADLPWYDSRVENCWFSGIPAAAIQSPNMQGVHIINNGLETSAIGLKFSGSDNVIALNRVAGNSKGINIDNGGSHNTIIGNHFTICGADDDVTAAIMLYAVGSALVQNTLIHGNNFSDNYNDVLVLSDAPNTATPTGVVDLAIAANTSYRPRRRFLWLQSAARVNLHGNLIEDTFATPSDIAAIDLVSPSVDVALVGNQVFRGAAGGHQYGLSIRAGASYREAGNHFEGSTAPVLNAGTDTSWHGPDLRTYADNAAAKAGGLTAGARYRTSAGAVMVVF